MNKAQRANFLKYLQQAGAVIESVTENPDATPFNEDKSPYYLIVQGGNLRVTFRAVSGTDFNHSSELINQLNRVIYPVMPSHLPTPDSENVSLDKGTKPTMTLSDKESNWTKVCVARLTTSGGYRYILKEEVIPRYAEPLRALATYFAAHQGQRPAVIWTPDAIAHFARSVAAAQRRTTFTPDNPIDFFTWAHSTDTQRESVLALQQVIAKVIPYLEQGQQPPDDLAREFTQAVTRHRHLHKDEPDTIDEPVSVPTIQNALPHEVTP